MPRPPSDPPGTRLESFAADGLSSSLLPTRDRSGSVDSLSSIDLDALSSRPLTCGTYARSCDSARSRCFRKRPKLCVCSAAVALVLLVYVALLGAAGAKLLASSKVLPSMTPVAISKLCEPEWVAEGSVVWNNQAFVGVDITIESVDMRPHYYVGAASVEPGVAFTMRARAPMHFAASMTTTLKSTLYVSVNDAVRTGQMMNSFLVNASVRADMVANMRVSIPLLPFSFTISQLSHDYLFASTMPSSEQHSYKWGPDGCKGQTTIKAQSINSVTILQNDAQAAQINVATWVQWFVSWQMKMEIPQTEWLLVNDAGGKKLATFNMPAVSIKTGDSEYTMDFNSTIIQQHAPAVGDAFAGMLEWAPLSLQMKGNGGGCPRFGKIIEQVNYPIYKWSSQMQDTYNTTWTINPCNTDDKSPRQTVLIDTSRVSMLSSNRSHAQLRVIMNETISGAGSLPTVSPTSQLAILRTATFPPFKVRVNRSGSDSRQSDSVSGDEILMVADVSLEGCWPISTSPQNDCTQTALSMIIDDTGTGRTADQVASDWIAGLSTNVTLQIIEVQSGKAKLTGGSGQFTWVQAAAEGMTRSPTVLSVIASKYNRTVQLDSNTSSSVSNSSQVWLDSVTGSYTEESKNLVLDTSLQLPAPMYVSGPDDPPAQHFLSQHSMGFDVSIIQVNGTCNNTAIAALNGIIDKAKKTLDMHVAVYDLEDTMINSPCVIASPAQPVATTVTVHAASPVPSGGRPLEHLQPSHPFVVHLSVLYNSSNGSSAIDYGKGFKTDNMCRKKFPFSLSTTAPSVISALGDIDILVTNGSLLYSAYPDKPGGEWHQEASVMHVVNTSSTPQMQVRGSQVVVDYFEDIVDSPELLGMMINSWYSTWLGIRFKVAGDFTVRSASGNAANIALDFHGLTDAYFEPGGKAITMFAIQTSQILVSDDELLRLQLPVAFDLRESIAAGYGFPIFDMQFPLLYFEFGNFSTAPYKYDPSLVYGNFTTAAFHADHESTYLGPIEFILEMRSSANELVRTAVRQQINYELGCRQESVYLAITGSQHLPIDDICAFQEAMHPLAYSLLPGYWNSTHPQNVRMKSLAIITSGTSLGVRMVLLNTTAQNIRGLVPALPELTTTLHGANASFGNVSISADVTTQALPSNESSATVQFLNVKANAGLGEGLTRIWESLMYGVDHDWSLRMETALNPQGIIDNLLAGASEAVTECSLTPAPSPAPPPKPPPPGPAPPLLPDGIALKLTSTPDELIGELDVNVTSALAAVAELLGHSFELGFESMEFVVQALDVVTGKVGQMPVISAKVLNFTSDKLAMQATISTATGASEQLGALVSQYLTQDVVALTTTVSVKGSGDANAAVNFDVDTFIPGMGASSTGCDGPGPPPPPSKFFKCPATGCQACVQGWICVKLSPTDGIGIESIVTNPLPVQISLASASAKMFAQGTAVNTGETLNGWHGEHKVADVFFTSTTFAVGETKKLTAQVTLDPSVGPWHLLTLVNMARSFAASRLDLRLAEIKVQASVANTTLAMDLQAPFVLEYDCTTRGVHMGDTACDIDASSKCEQVHVDRSDCKWVVSAMGERA